MLITVHLFAGDVGERPLCNSGDISLPADGMLEGQGIRFQTGIAGELPSGTNIILEETN